MGMTMRKWKWKENAKEINRFSLAISLKRVKQLALQGDFFASLLMVSRSLGPELAWPLVKGEMVKFLQM